MISAFPPSSILGSTEPGRSLLTAADVPAQRSLLGLGTLATQSANIADYLTIASAIANFQPLNSNLTAIAELSTAAYGRSLLTQADAPAARTTLGLGTGDSPTFNGLTVSGSVSIGTATLVRNSADDFRISSGDGFQRVRAYSLWSDMLGAGIGDSGVAGGAAVHLAANAALGWTSGGNINTGTYDLFVRRDAANILAQRNGVNAQTLRVYNTFTDASNHERAKFAWESNILRIGTERAGTGSARALELQTDGTTRLTINTAGNAVFSGNISSSTGVMQLSNVMFACSSSIANFYGNLLQPVSLRVYNTTDAGFTNFEYGQFAWNSNVLQIGTVKGGTGVARALELQTDGATRLTISAAGAATFALALTVGTTLQVGNSGNILRSNGARIEARDATNSAYQNIAGLSLITTHPDVGSNATPVNSNLELRFFNASYLAGMVRGRGRAQNSAFGDVVISANPDVFIVNGSNLTDDIVVRGNNGDVQINRGELILASATTARASLQIQPGVDPTVLANGDIWFDGTNLKIRIGGVTRTVNVT